MKILTYKIEGYTSLYNPETEETTKVQTLTSVTIERPTDDDIATAEEIAYNGEYTIEDDGVEDVVEPTPQDDTDAMLIDHEYRLTLLELGLV